VIMKLEILMNPTIFGLCVGFNQKISKNYSKDSGLFRDMVRSIPQLCFFQIFEIENTLASSILRLKILTDHVRKSFISAGLWNISYPSSCFSTSIGSSRKT
jgi:hypothetical protein